MSKDKKDKKKNKEQSSKKEKQITKDLSKDKEITKEAPKEIIKETPKEIIKETEVPNQSHLSQKISPRFLPKKAVNPIHVAVVGATGAVGKEFIEAFKQNQLNIASLKLYASERSAGEVVEFQGEELVVEDLALGSWKKDQIDIAFFSAGAKVSKEYAPQFVAHKITVIDNTSAFRMDRNVPLVVPEVNPQEAFKHQGIIANPNCSTIEAMPVLATLDQCYGLKRVVYSTYQSASGAGKTGMDELHDQTVALLNFKQPKVHKFPKRLAFDLIPKIGDFLDDGNTQEEEKMIKESQKILGISDLSISATCVRVPTFIGHCLSVNVELQHDFEIDVLIDQLKQTQNVKVFDAPEFPTLMDVAGLDTICVGRIRRDSSVRSAVNLWIVADNLRKGAATNAVQIAQVLYGTSSFTAVSDPSD